MTIKKHPIRAYFMNK
jgi:hypothetical protein